MDHRQMDLTFKEGNSLVSVDPSLTELEIGNDSSVDRA